MFRTLTLTILLVLLAESTQAQTKFEKWRTLAEQGNAVAQSNVGFLYQTGDVVSQDDKEAMRWYRKAAAQGDGRGATNTATLYLSGLGVPQDFLLARMWLNLPGGVGPHYTLVGSRRDILAKRMTPAQ